MTDHDRLQRLEEVHAFSEHTLEQLSAEMAELSRRLAAAVQRLDRLEARIEQLREKDPEKRPGAASPAEATDEDPGV
jgi:uncharacterized coiled-coil protein SlyX